MKPVSMLVSLFPLVLAVSCGSEASEIAAAGIEKLGIKNLANPVPGIFSAGQPSENQFQQLFQQGYRHLVCLREKSERGTGWEEARAKELGVRFTRIEISGNDSLTKANAIEVAAAITIAGDAPTLVYCGGSNRVGAMLAMRACLLEGKSVDEAIKLGQDAGMKTMESAVRAALELK